MLAIETHLSERPPIDSCSLDETNVGHLIERLAQRVPHGIAIGASGRSPLSYGRLIPHVKCIVETLKTLGVGRNDRVAIVLPNGPEMATALLSVISCATAAPLNPAYGAADFDFYLSDLNAKVLMIQSGSESPARAIARERGITILELSPVAEAEAGIFKLTGEGRGATADTDYSSPEDIALVLHTSGTTSRPKIVPLTQANILSSASYIKTTLALTGRDRCLNAMPLFHIHGLMVTLSSLFAGGSVYPILFDAQRFFQYMDEFAPTWYSAVPTVHQAILRAGESHQDIIARSPLRFVRSASAALPGRVKVKLEKVFNAPVLEAYGMTEAAHQIVSDPLPPGERKPGSVGLAAGPEVAIMDEEGTLLPSGLTGEIVIRGANVFQGYENNQAANTDAFTNGWFRTGDRGYLDPAGYLFITGRLKDIINRGGEKISPAEVDSVLMNHAAVEEAVAFPVAHPTLGEDMIAAVVLRQNATATGGEIREFVAARVTGSKVPRRVLILEEIPKGPSGKLQRRTLAKQLGHFVSNGARPKSAPAYVAPIETVEHQLVQIWEEVLSVRPLGTHDNFFEFGGDSLLAVEMMRRVEQECGEKGSLSTLLAGPTIEQLAKVLVRHQIEERNPLLVKIQPGKDKLPFFFLHGDWLGGGFYCLNLARYLGEAQPFYALTSFGVDGGSVPTTIEEMAAAYVGMVRAVQPEGPYILGGLCHGAVIAFEMAQQLTRQGHQVPLVVMIGVPADNHPRMRYLQGLVNWIANLLGMSFEWQSNTFLKLRYRWVCLRRFYLYARSRLNDAASLPLHKQIRWAFRSAMKVTKALAQSVVKGGLAEQSGSRRNIYPNMPHPPEYHNLLVRLKAQAKYVPRPYSGRVVVFWPIDAHMHMWGERDVKWSDVSDRTLGWNKVVTNIEVTELPGDYATLVTKHVETLAECIKNCFDSLQVK